MNLLITGAWQQAQEHITELEQMGHKVAFLQQEKAHEKNKGKTTLALYQSPFPSKVKQSIFPYMAIWLCVHMLLYKACNVHMTHSQWRDRAGFAPVFSIV